MKCTGSYPAKVHYTFTLPSGNGHWGFNFNSVAYPGSKNVVITRASDGRHWTVESNGLKGELLSWGHGGLRRRKSGPSHEGFFVANFKFTIEVVSRPSQASGALEGQERERGEAGAAARPSPTTRGDDAIVV